MDVTDPTNSGSNLDALEQRIEQFIALLKQLQQERDDLAQRLQQQMAESVNTARLLHEANERVQALQNENSNLRDKQEGIRLKVDEMLDKLESFQLK